MGKTSQNRRGGGSDRKSNEFVTLKRKREGNFQRNEQRKDFRNDREYPDNNRNKDQGNFNSEIRNDRNDRNDRGRGDSRDRNNDRKNNNYNRDRNNDRRNNSRDDRGNNNFRRGGSSGDKGGNYNNNKDKRNSSNDRKSNVRNKDNDENNKSNFHVNNKERDNNNRNQGRDRGNNNPRRNNRTNSFNKDRKNFSREGRGKFDRKGKRNFSSKNKKAFGNKVRQKEASLKKSKALLDPVFLGGKKFNDALYIYEEAGKILLRYKGGEPLKGKDSDFMMDLLKYHERYEEKARDIDYITIGKAPEHKVSWCFFIVRKNNDKIDFSYRKCIDRIRAIDRAKKKNVYTKTIK